MNDSSNHLFIAASPNLITFNHASYNARYSCLKTPVRSCFEASLDSVTNDDLMTGTADIKASITIQATVITASRKRSSHGETLQCFKTNQTNRKQLSCFWPSQCFSTGETIPDITLLRASASRGAIKRPHMIQRVCLQHGARQSTSFLFTAKLWSPSPLLILTFSFSPTRRVPKSLFID